MTQHQDISKSTATQHLRVWEFTWEAISNDFETIFIFIVGGQDKNVDLNGEDRVPSFWANGFYSDEVRADMIVLGVGVCFGAIHCIAWGFLFPTYTELLMWRVLCVAITAVPIYISLGSYLAAWLVDMMPVFYFISLSGGILYILARAVTLVLALTSLRDLPPGAYETVHWTTFIPHV